MNISSLSNTPYAQYQQGLTFEDDSIAKEQRMKDEKEADLKALVEDSPIEKDKEAKADPEYRRKIEEFKAVEREVTAHEMAHKSVGGQYASSASFTYSIGPDGKRYKTGGEVSIDVPTGGNLEQTEIALERVKQAALAPANPSGQDLRVAANAAATQQRIRAELTRQKAIEVYEKVNAKSDTQNNEKGQLDIAI